MKRSTEETMLEIIRILDGVNSPLADPAHRHAIAAAGTKEA